MIAVIVASALSIRETFLPFDSLDYCLRHGATFTGSTGTYVLCNYHRVIVSPRRFEGPARKDWWSENDADFTLSQLQNCHLQRCPLPLHFFYSCFNSNRCLLCATLSLGDPLHKVQSEEHLSRWSCFLRSLLLLAVLLPSSSQPPGKETSCNDWTAAHPMPQSLDLSDLIVAPFNRFMAAILWHMSGRLSAIMRFWPDKRSYKFMKRFKHSAEAYVSARRGRTSLDVCAAKSGVSFGNVPAGMRLEAQRGTMFEVFLSAGCQARRSS